MATSTRPGDVLAGRYRLIDLLSESGGGRFWRAHDAVLERYVALHVISESDPRAPRLIEAARSSATVLDPRILRVLDAETRGGLCFVVNEWGTGTSLDILVASAGPLAPHPAAWLVAEVAAAIARTHEAGVCHGRLNPENILIDRLGAVRIIGLCVDSALHGLPPGTPAQDRADLGGLLYCALTGRWPGPSASQVAPAHRAHGATLAPRQALAGVPRALDDVWREIDHADRHQAHRWRIPSSVGGHEHPEVSTAHAISERMLEFVGDPAGLADRLASSILPINEVRPVSLPALSDPPVRVPSDAGHRTTGTTPAAPDPDPVTEPDLDPPTEVEVEAEPEADPASGAPPASGQPDAETDAETDSEADSGADDVPAAPAAGGKHAAPKPPGSAVTVDVPTEAGMPVFGEGDDVEWLRARSTPPPPPPPFEEPPERPLFAPDPPSEARRARALAASPTPVEIAAQTQVHGPGSAARTPGPGDYWPWDVQDDGTAERDLVVEEDEDGVPGRTWLRIALAVGLIVVLMVGVVVAYNAGTGRGPLGALGTETTGPTRGSSPAPSVAPTTLAEITATDFDPLGDDGEEYPELAGAAVDGDPATAWRTQTYSDQFGPPRGLKTGVGLLLDLGENRTVTAVDVEVVGSPADVAMTISREPPSAAPEDFTFEGTARNGSLTVEADTQAVSDGTTTGRYLLVWFTSLPQVPGGFRVEVPEVVVRGH